MANFPGTTGNDGTSAARYGGTAQADTVSDGGGGNDWLAGLGGDDVITVTGGADDVDGGTGSDRLVMIYSGVTSSGGYDLINLSGSLAAGYSGLFDGSGSANTQFYGVEHFTFSYTGSGSLDLRFGDGDDVLTAGSGNDTLNTGAGVDVVDGGAGNDRWAANLAALTSNIVVNLTANTSNGLGAGSVRNVEGFAGVTGGRGNDVFTGKAVDGLIDLVNGGEGNDVITLFGLDADVVQGGAGADRLVLTITGADSSTGVSLVNFAGSLAAGYSGLLDGSASNNLEYSGIESFDLSYSGSAAFIMQTGDGDDRLAGGTGADTLNSGGGVDAIDGGIGGGDRWGANYGSATQAIVIDLQLAISRFLGTGSVSNVEGFAGLTTGSGNDRITGTGGDVLDVVSTGAGNDVITLFGMENDNVNGGADRDKLVVEAYQSDSSNGVSMSNFAGSLAAGYSGLLDGAGSNNITFAGIEDVDFQYFGSGPVTLTFGDGNDRLFANSGNDTLNGGGGDDVIWGGEEGVDTVNGGGGSNDLLFVTYANSTLATTTVPAAFVNGANRVNHSGFERIDISTGDAADAISTGAGNDIIDPGLSPSTATDQVNAGIGSDLLRVQYGDVALAITSTVTAGVSSVLIAGGGGVLYEGVERVEIIAGWGDDTLIGHGQSDVLAGREGNDILVGGLGNDVLVGAEGVDTARFASSFLSTTFRFRGQSVVVTGADGSDQVFAVERFQFLDRTIERDAGDGVDDLFYYAMNPDVYAAGIDADDHFNGGGRAEGRAPNALFDRAYYLQSNPDVAAAGIDPWLHFIGGGWTEGRNPSAAFNVRDYLQANADVAASGENPLLHYLRTGADEQRQRYVLFDDQFYLDGNPDVAASGLDPYVHWSQGGRLEGRDPSYFFDADGYLANYPDVAAAGLDPLAHYLSSGWLEGRDPSTQFDTGDYLIDNPDVAAAGVNPLLHYLVSGQAEGRRAFDDGVWG